MNKPRLASSVCAEEYSSGPWQSSCRFCKTFEGGDVDEVLQRCTYTMQHDPTSLLTDLKKLVSFAYRRGFFSGKRFDHQDGFSIAYFLKDLMLEIPSSVQCNPLVVEFCLMWGFPCREDRFQNQNDFLQHGILTFLDDHFPFESRHLFRGVFLLGRRFRKARSCSCHICTEIPCSPFPVTDGASTS